MAEISIPPHLEHLDFGLYGGSARVLASLKPGEVIQYASHGWLEMSSRPGGGGKRLEGLLLLTDRGVVLVRSPGVLRKNPTPVIIPFTSIFNAGPHKSAPEVVVIASNENHVVVGRYLVFADEQEAIAIIWGNVILEGAEAAGGRASAP
jgi:hypothetical protein